MSFCAEGCLSDVNDFDRQMLTNRIMRKLGAPVMGVELIDEQIEECFCEAIEEYSYQVNNWVLQNRLGEMLGLPSEVDFTLKYISNSLYFEKSFSKAYGEQAGLGANGTREVKQDFIALTAGTQNYIIPANREVDEILWFTPSYINLFGLDPFSNTNIAFTEFGASFAGQTLYHVMPVFDTILTAQAAELRNRVRGSEYSHIIRPGSNGTKVLRLSPIPTNTQGMPDNGYGIGGGAGTPGTIFYTYRDRDGLYGNPDFVGSNANPGWTGATGGTNVVGNGLVSGPSDAKLNLIKWSQLNSVAQTWVRKYAQAKAKELLGIGIRGKFKGALPIPDAEVTLNYDDLISNGREDAKELIDQLREDLKEMSYEKIMEKKASIQESINKTLGYGPMGLFVF